MVSFMNQAALAQAALAYKLYEEKFSGPRWEALKSRGAQKQRLLWASTSVKNPAYPDTLYVSPLIGPDTVSFNTLSSVVLQQVIWSFFFPKGWDECHEYEESQTR